MVSLYVNLASVTKPSRYINKEINSVCGLSGSKGGTSRPEVRVALAFPDIYDIGMSHLGFKILYKIVNDLPFASAERVFAPWTDMENFLRGKGEPLRSLETRTPLREFDIVGFSLQYELSYTTVLNMLDLGGIPVGREDRDDKIPLVIAGGPCSVNPMPMSKFIDAFVIGDAEEKIVELLHVYQDTGGRRGTLLKELSLLDGVFVPGHSSGKTKRVIITDLDSAPYPTAPVVPYTKIVHDRINIEVSRGCSMGCRFCQAGMMYRPVRERGPDTVLSIAEESLKNTGHDEVSFTSLSTGDYSQLIPLLKRFNGRFAHKRTALSLPSLRVGAVNDEILKELRVVRKGGFTIAPEAGTERLRCVINKDFNEEDYESALRSLFGAGWQTVKLYFMIGLPTETWEDVKAIVGMAQKALGIAKRYTKRRININVGISPFVPKPHTPFQWRGQEDVSLLTEKKTFILKSLSKRVFTVKSHNESMSLLEAAVTRGDERMGDLIEAVWKSGARLEGWSECFDFSTWEKAMDKTGIDVKDYAGATPGENEDLPWDVIDTGIRKEFLYGELESGLNLKKTPNCSFECRACGLGCKSGQFLTTDGNVKKTAGPNIRHGRFSPVKVRAEFSKKGELRLLSHLELTAALLRALRRAEAPLCYSEGFHPSPKVSFGPALGVGAEGESEYFDMEVFPPFDIAAFQEKIDRLLPDDITLKKMVFIDKNLPSLNSFINCYEYFFTFSEDLSVRNFIMDGDNASRFKPLIIDSAIIDDATVKILIRETEKEKIRMADLLAELFGVTAERVLIKRTGMWGLFEMPVSPMDISKIAEIYSSRGKKGGNVHGVLTPDKVKNVK